GGGLERLAGPLAGEVGGGEPPELVVDQGEQFGGGPAVPGRGRRDQARDVGHAPQCTRPGPGHQLPTENCPQGTAGVRRTTPVLLGPGCVLPNADCKPNMEGLRPGHPSDRTPVAPRRQRGSLPARSPPPATGAALQSPSRGATL